MDVIHKKEKLRGSEQKSGNFTIVVTHVNIRQSIFILLLKLLVLEFIAAGCLVLFQSFFFTPYATRISLYFHIELFNTPFFLLLVLLKIITMCYVVFSWLEEYYEIYPTEVIHKKGIIFKKEQRYLLKHIGSVGLQQGVLGRIFNFGSIKLYDWLLGKDVYLYLIHNPLRYHGILKKLLVESDKEKEIFRERVVESEDEELLDD